MTAWQARSMTAAGTAWERLRQWLRPYTARLVVTVVLVLVLTAVNIVVPRTVGMIFNWVFPDNNWTLLTLLLTALLALYIMRNLLYFYSKFSAVAIGENLSFTLRKQLFERLQQMKLHYYRQNKPGELSSRVMNDSFVIQQFMQDQVPKLLQSSLLFLGVVAAMFVMNWQLALASTIVLPLHLVTFHYFHGPIKRASRSASESTANATGNLIEKFLGIEVVKSFTAEHRENAAFQQAIDRSRQNQLRGFKFQVGQKVMADVLIGLGMIALLAFGAYQVMAEGMPHGDLVAFFWYVKMLYPTVTELMSSIARVPRASASIERVSEVLDSPGDERSDEPALKPEIRGRITFEHVWFRYAQEDQWVLEDIDVTVEAGEVCAIVGPSGSGKSTLVHTVPRFIDPSVGRILIDGFDSKLVDLTYLRQQIGFAFQECFLFNSTILENLRYAWPEASIELIEDVARQTGAHDFIQKLPQGYDTIVGEKGVSLSRGQKQLITLTRAMLKNPRILILDEATASVDEQHEAKVISNIRRFMQNKTTLMITHRPELLRHADRVIELSDGRVVASGPPEAEPPHRPAAASVDPEAPIDDPREPSGFETGFDPDRDRRRSGESSGHWPAIVPMLLAGVLIGVGVLTGSAAGQTKTEQTRPSTHPPAVKSAEGKASAAGATTDKTKSPATQPKPAARALQPAANEEGQPFAVSEAGRLIALPKADRAGARELVRLLASHAQAMGYRVTAADNFATLPRGPQDLEAQTHLKKPTQRGQRFLQIGFQSFTSQPHQLWLYGVTRRGKGLAANTDLPLLEKELEKLRANIKVTDQPKAFPVAELRSRRLTLSYTSVDRCTKVLRSLGYNVVKPGESKTKTPGMLKPEELPMVMAVPAASGNETSLVGNKQYTVGGSGGNRNIAELKKTVGAPTTQLLVFYNPNQPQQYARLHEVVRNSIDVPARQIMIEAMVLELSETTLEKLGVNWKLQNPLGGELDNISDLQFGKLPNFTGDEEKTFQLNIDGISNHWRAELEALVRDGRARILSRPSVLTLNNRQAFIRVGEDIPIATSVRGTERSDLISFDFEYIPVGISLNVRPRVSAEDKKISMQINGDVSATVPGEDLIIRDEDGDVAASAPRLSQRRVQTYARVANNTPFIIGGLISEDNTVQTDKVPLLGDIPIAGALFRDKEVNQLKREVIIVLTPYVLPRDQVVGRNLPKDEDAFDSFGNELFRDAYRIRAEDVFDLSFLTENKHLQRMQALADKAINRNYDLRERYPFSQFVDGHIPGERILVYRQMYEVIKRKGLADELSLGKIIFFEANPRAPSNFSVAFLEPWLRDLVKNRDLGELEPEQSPMAVISDSGKAVALTYKDRGQSQKAGDILSQPVPEVELIDCPSDAAWSEKLWSLNQPTEAGQKRYTIILRNESDLMRLKRAVVLKRTVQLNGQRKSLTLDNFSVGRQLLLPEVNPEKVRLVDADVANYFFLTEQYYPALQKQLRQASEALRRSLRKLNVRLPESSP